MCACNWHPSRGASETSTTLAQSHASFTLKASRFIKEQNQIQMKRSLWDQERRSKAARTQQRGEGAGRGGSLG